MSRLRTGWLAAMALMGALGCGQDASLPRFAPPVTPAPVEAGPSQEAEPPQSGSAGGTSETRTVAHSTAPAPPQHGGNETASEAGGPEAMEGEAAPSRTAETAFALPAPAALPPTPGNFRAAASSSSAVDLSWDAAAGADSYEVRYREDGGTWENWTGVGDVTSFTVTGLAAQTEYEFEVRTVVGTEQSAVATASAATTADPAPRDPNCEDLPPSISVSAASSTSVRVSWRADRAPGCENLFDVSGPGLNLSGTSDTSRTVGDLDPGTEYCYTVSMDGRGSDRDCATTHTEMCDVSISATVTATSGATVSVRVSASSSNCTVTVSGGNLSGNRTPPVTDTVTCGFKYTYTATASGAGYQTKSATASATPTCPECRITARINARRPDASERRINVSWGATTTGDCERITFDVSRGSVSLFTGTTQTSTTDYSCRARTYTVTATAGTVSDSAEDDVGACEIDPGPGPGPTPTPAPGGFEAAAGSSSSIGLSWDSVSRADSYEYVRRMGSGSFPPDADAVDVGDVTEYDDTGLPSNAEYCYRVRTVDGSRKSAWTSEACATTLPETPDNFGAEAASGTSVELSWDGVSGADSYEVRRRKSGGSWSSWSDVGSVTEYTVSGLDRNADYDFEVRTVIGAARSAAAAASASTTPPGVPANFEVAAASATAMDLSWDAVSGADSYEIQRREGSGSFPPDADAGDVGSVTEREDTGLSSNTRYCYRVRSVDGALKSAWSAEGCATTDPPPPSNFRAEAASDTSVELSWDGVSGADSYEVRYLQAGGSWGSWTDVGSETSHTVSGLEMDTEYEFEIRTVVGTVKSVAASASARTEIEPSWIPEDFTATAVSSTVIRLAWEEVEPATGYRLRRRLHAAATWGEEFAPDSDTGHRDTGLIPDTRYCYAVRALGGPVVEWSGEVCARTKRLAPSGLRATRVSRTGVDMVWDEQPGVDNYGVYVSGRFIPRRGAELSVTGLEAAETYEFQVVSRINDVESERSGVLTVTTANPMGPASLEVEAVPTAVTLSWPAGSGEGSWSGPGGSGRHELTYKLDRRSPAGTGDFALLEEGLTERSYVDEELTPETEYEYRVRTTVQISDFTLHSGSGTTETVTTPGYQPPHLEATATSSVSVELRWDAVPEASGYEFRWSPDGETWNTAESAGTGTSHEHTDLTPETEYHYQVRVAAMAGMGDLPWSESAQAETRRLETPEDLEAEVVTPVGVELGWSSVAAAHGYEIERQVSEQEPDAPVEVSMPAYAQSALNPETTYAYRVRSVRSDANPSLWTEPLSLTTPAAAAPATLDIEVWDWTSIELNWEEAPGAAAYRVRYRPVGADEWYGSSAELTGTYLVTRGLEPDTEHEVEVIAIYVTGEGKVAAPPIAEVVRTLPLPEPPETPTELQAEAVSSSSVRLRWETAEWDDDHPVAGELRYEVQRRTGDGEWTLVEDESDGSPTERVDTGLTANTEYSYRVRSVSSHTERHVRPVRLESDWTEPVSVTTDP